MPPRPTCSLQLEPVAVQRRHLVGPGRFHAGAGGGVESPLRLALADEAELRCVSPAWWAGIPTWPTAAFMKWSRRAWTWPLSGCRPSAMTASSAITCVGFWSCSPRIPDLCDVVRGVLRGQPCPIDREFLRLRSAGVLAGESARTHAPALPVVCQLPRETLAMSPAPNRPFTSPAGR